MLRCAQLTSRCGSTVTRGPRPRHPALRVKCAGATLCLHTVLVAPGAIATHLRRHFGSRVLPQR